MLSLSALNAFYGDGHILHDITLEVGTGERVAVIGRNGAGKSTLLKSIIGDEPRVTGGLSFRGGPLTPVQAHQRARMGVAFVPEDRRIFPMLTVAENIRLATRSSGRGDKRSPDEMFVLFPMLAPLAGRYGDQLSGGQQQMLAVARGLAVRPQMLLLDEPTEGLAPVIVEELAAAVLKQCRAEGITLILCEQNIRFARQCTDRVHVLNSGTLVFSGSWADFDRDESVKSRYLAV